MAHNGKCADRLIKTSPFVTDAHAALPCRFTAQASPTSNRLELSSLFVCVLEIPRSAATFDGAFIEGDKILSWAGNNSCKYPSAEGNRHNDIWTLISTPQYGSANKCSQENIPSEVHDKVCKEMCSAFAVLLGADASKWPVLHLQLWGAALPLNLCAQHFVHDPQSRVGVCGDWLTSPSVEGALFSGLALAEALQRDLRSGGLQASGVKRFHGLTGGHAIGDFGLCDTKLTVAQAVDSIDPSKINVNAADANAAKVASAPTTDDLGAEKDGRSDDRQERSRKWQRRPAS